MSPRPSALGFRPPGSAPTAPRGRSGGGAVGADGAHAPRLKARYRREHPSPGQRAPTGTPSHAAPSGRHVGGSPPFSPRGLAAETAPPSPRRPRGPVCSEPRRPDEGARGPPVRVSPPAAGAGPRPPPSALRPPPSALRPPRSAELGAGSQSRTTGCTCETAKHGRSCSELKPPLVVTLKQEMPVILTPPFSLHDDEEALTGKRGDTSEPDTDGRRSRFPQLTARRPSRVTHTLTQPPVRRGEVRRAF